MNTTTASPLITNEAEIRSQGQLAQPAVIFTGQKRDEWLTIILMPTYSN